MGFQTLPDGRQILPSGTEIEFSTDGGTRYRITGKPVGHGGSSILYPAVRIRFQDGQWIEDAMRVVLKEAYPNTYYLLLNRSENGQITAFGQKDAEAAKLLQSASEMMKEEKHITGQIYNKAFRMTPLWQVCSEERIFLEGREGTEIFNTYGILERLDEKGVSLGSILSDKDRLFRNAYQMVCVINQVLMALQEVHNCGFLHGDIQENNIFLKGHDPEAGDCGLATLIDFGSARALWADGATEVIEDRSLFSTEGYTAPECMSGNDGTLRLTRAADIYSVGYLLLRMLSGRRIDSRALQLVMNGKYIYRKQAQKIGCTQACEDMLNKILAKALAGQPEERYQSAGEMLEDTKRLERALAPVKNSIAAVDYEAFISYCHEEKSIQAAKQLQTFLEHYKIPKVIQKSSGKRKLKKVFRDQEELSSSSDMSRQLREALEHSEYLIVLLSPKVPDSPWVTGEIETFLETHTRDRILTVLVEGEPEQVFPECLKAGEKAVQMPDGTAPVKKKPIESLAADIRGATKREQKNKLKTEGYRLLAPLLGCSYDDLRQRQKEYRMKKMLRFTGAAAVFLALFAGFSVKQALEIRENYRAVLKEKSRYLADVSSDLLAQGDRIGAVRAAVEALPAGEADYSKPLVPEAEAALNAALYSYNAAVGNRNFRSADRLLTMEAQADTAESFSADESLLLSTDQNDSIYLWDTEDGSCQKKWDKKDLERLGLEGDLQYAAFLEDDSILMLSDHTVLRTEMENDRVLWKHTFHEELQKQAAEGTEESGRQQWEPYHENVENWVLSQDKKLFAAAIRDTAVSEQDCFFLLLFDTETGTLRCVRNGFLDGEEELKYSSVHIQKIALDRNHQYAALSFADHLGEFDTVPNGVLLVVDLENGEIHRIAEEETDIFWDVQFQADGSLAALSYPYETNQDILEQSVTGSIQSFNADNGNLIWEQNFAGQASRESGYGLYSMVTESETEEKCRVLAVWSNRNLYVVEENTGKILYSLIAENEITGVSQYSDTTLIAGEADGSIFAINLKENVWVDFKTNVTRQNKKFIYRNEIVYFVDAADCSVALLKKNLDESGERLEYDGKIAYLSGNEQYLAAGIQSGGEEDSQTELVIRDAEQKEEMILTCSGILHDMEITENNQLLYLSGTDVIGTQELVCFDMEQQTERWWGKTTYSSIAHVGQEAAVLYSDDMLGILNLEKGNFEEEFVFRTEQEEKEEQTQDTDVTEGQESTVVEIITEAQSHIEEVEVSADGRYIGIIFSDFWSADITEKMKVYDRKQKSWLKETEEWQNGIEKDYKDHILMGENQNLLAVYNNERSQTLIYNLDTGKIQCIIPLSGESRRSMCFVKGDKYLATWGHDRYLRLWDTDTGTPVQKSDEQLSDVMGIEALGTDYFSVETAVYYGDVKISSLNHIYSLDNAGQFCTYVILERAQGDEELENIYSVNGNNNSVTIYHKYSLDELLERAEEITADAKQYNETDLSADGGGVEQEDTKRVP